MSANVNAATAELMKKADLIIWDEISMQHRHVFEAVDRTLRDVRKNEPGETIWDTLFNGGIITLFCGDFRQVLPVVPRGSKAQIVRATLKFSAMWNTVRVFTLQKNWRV